MWGYLIISIVIVLAAAAAVVLIANAQSKARRKELRLEITNCGNVRSRYELRAEDSEGALQFQFSLDGDPLPAREIAAAADAGGAKPGQPAPPKPVEAAGIEKRASQASGFAGTIADGLGTVADFLPGSVRAPLDRISGRLRSGQVKVSRVRQTTGRVQRVRSAVRRKAKTQPQAALPAGVETPFVKPAETLVLDLWVRAAVPGPMRAHPFVVRSRSVEQKDAPWVAEDGRVQLRAPSGLSRYLPYLIVLVVAAAILALVVWLASSGGLG